ncbi:MAG TPA: [protein-PII] uridylyltransferase [Polyangiaceae bacterium]|nr:[protein-PII] uridylyltransferase [Polyangiaceae bacterium]
MTFRATRISPPPSPETLALRDSVERHRAVLLSRLRAGDDGMALGRANAAFLEACFKRCFDGAATRAGLPRGVALAAVGSFGRGAVALRSDADVLLVVDPREVSPTDASGLVEALLYPLWDATLSVGHQVLAAADAVSLATHDLPMATALLDLRLLGGDQAVYDALIDRVHEGVFGEEGLGVFIDRLEAEAASRHERYGDSVFLLEPDVKAGAGGLRDLDGALWAARARYRLRERGGESLRRWTDLVRVGALLAREEQDVVHAEEFLWRLRNRLHARAERKSDRLGFDDQESAAVAMGYGDDRAQAAERMMQRYYVHARAVTRVRSSLFERLRPAPRRRDPPVRIDLGGGVWLFDGQVSLAGSAELRDDPALALRVYTTSAVRDAPVLGFARDAIARAADDPAWCDALRASAEAAELFVQIVCHVPDAAAKHRSILGELSDVGLLLAMVPEFSPVVGRVHHDVYHVYTVDVHSIAAVDRLRHLVLGALSAQFPLATCLASRSPGEGPPSRALFLATLLHDVGKGWPEVDGTRMDHPRAGAALCDRILPRLGLSAQEVSEARSLVVDHLRMYSVATRRDIEDASTVEEFCRTVGGREGLRRLYLLTVADVSTTSPSAMTSWKARMLDALYKAADKYLAGQQNPTEDVRAEEISDAVRALWPGERSPLDQLLGALPKRYLLANAPESIVRHAMTVGARGGRAAHVARVPSRHAEAAELCVVADDRPGLLASIAAAITANRLEVLGAEVYSHPVGVEREALDLFWVRDRASGVAEVDEILPRLARDLEDVCSGRVDPASLLRDRTGNASRWSVRPTPAVPTEILFDDDASPRHTVVEVHAKDRRGLLYTLARALYELGLSISLSKISTEGARVTDVFYVREIDGTKVAVGPRRQRIVESLLRAVDGAVSGERARTEG